MATSRLSSKTRKVLERAKRLRSGRIREARADYFHKVESVVLLDELRRHPISVDAFFARVPKRLLDEARTVFDRIPQKHRVKYRLSSKQERLPGFGAINVWRLGADEREHLMNFMLSDYLEVLKITKTQAINVSKAQGNNSRGWPKELLSRERFTRDQMNNFNMHFQLWPRSSPLHFNNSFGAYGVSIELLEKRFPNLMKRVEGYSRMKDKDWGRVTKQEMDDYYKIYKVLRGEFGIPNRELMA